MNNSVTLACLSSRDITFHFDFWPTKVSVPTLVCRKTSFALNLLRCFSSNCAFGFFLYIRYTYESSQEIGRISYLKPLYNSLMFALIIVFACSYISNNSESKQYSLVSLFRDISSHLLSRTTNLVSTLYVSLFFLIFVIIILSI